MDAAFFPPHLFSINLSIQEAWPIEQSGPLLRLTESYKPEWIGLTLPFLQNVVCKPTQQYSTAIFNNEFQQEFMVFQGRTCQIRYLTFCTKIEKKKVNNDLIEDVNHIQYSIEVKQKRYNVLLL